MTNTSEMRKIILAVISLWHLATYSQNNSTVKEYKKVYLTYPFSDPNPIPEPSSLIYPYFRYDGYTDKPVQQEWKVVEMENDFIKLTITPEIGGKIWSAVEKKTGKEFLYNNPVVKFRDVAMRGPWTSGGIEANYGILGHTPNCATPVDYTILQKEDGSVSCIIGALDLLTQTNWRLEINLPKDKAYFTTRSFWYNASPLEQPYYTWMNTGIKAAGNLEFIYPGTRYLGHDGEYSDWPVNKSNGKKISWYEENNFGGYKSYHVFGTYTDFFGAYWHRDGYGMVRYAPHDEKAGKKIWIWGLSHQGMIWEKLLTDGGGQYVEVQSGRLFSQSATPSVYTPFKYRGFAPNETDWWTEYWYPVVNTGGMVIANEHGGLNVRKIKNWLKIDFCPLQSANETIRIKTGGNITEKNVRLAPLQTFTDSVRITDTDSIWSVGVGDKIYYSNKGFSDASLSRPVQSPPGFNWNSVYGLYVSAKSLMEQRMYAPAAEKVAACLQLDEHYAPALVLRSELEYRKMNYANAFEAASQALAINTYDATTNYYYGLAALKLNKLFDAKDGFDIASQSAAYRVPAFMQLAYMYFRDGEWNKAADYADKSITYNRYNMDAWQLLAIIYRTTGKTNLYEAAIGFIRQTDPLNHFVAFEQYISTPSEENKRLWMAAIKNELPAETCLELAVWYYNINCLEAVKKILLLAPAGEEVNIWRDYYSVPYKQPATNKLTAAFPFRAETATLLEEQIAKNSNWRLKYALALIYAGKNNMEKALQLFSACGNEPSEAAFYGARASLIPQQAENDLQKAFLLDKEQWRFPKRLAEHYIEQAQYGKALQLAEPFYLSHKNNYIMGMLYAKTLLLNKRYKDCDQMLAQLHIIPFEGATDGRALYRECKLQQALSFMQVGNYKQALVYINDSGKWPEQLGVGKPYEEDIDFRLENWMISICYRKLNKKREADNLMTKITAFKPGIHNTVSNFLPANHLITAWAMEKINGREAAGQWLDAEIKKYPENNILPWCREVFQTKKRVLGTVTDSNALLLLELMLIK
jgi:hypothetical protein